MRHPHFGDPMSDFNEGPAQDASFNGEHTIGGSRASHPRSASGFDRSCGRPQYLEGNCLNPIHGNKLRSGIKG